MTGKTLEQRLDDLPAFDLPAMRELARAYLDEVGDIPPAAFYVMGFIQHDAPAAWRELQAMREPRPPHEPRFC